MGENFFAAPPVTDELRAQAAERPGGWVYAIDPYFDPAAKVPAYGVIGAWKVDINGRIAGEFQKNPNYRPSPIALGFPAPTDPVDDVLQRVAARYASEAELRRILLDSTVHVEPLVYKVDNRGPIGSVVSVYTSLEHAREVMAQTQSVPCRELLENMPRGLVLKVNPGSPVSVAVSVHDLLSG